MGPAGLQDLAISKEGLYVHVEVRPLLIFLRQYFSHRENTVYNWTFLKEKVSIVKYFEQKEREKKGQDEKYSFTDKID